MLVQNRLTIPFAVHEIACGTIYSGSSLSPLRLLVSIVGYHAAVLQLKVYELGCPK